MGRRRPSPPHVDGVFHVSTAYIHVIGHLVGHGWLRIYWCRVHPPGSGSFFRAAASSGVSRAPGELPCGIKPSDTADESAARCRAAVADALTLITEVDYVVCTSGSFDLLFELVCEDDDHLLNLLNDRVRTIPGVRSTETFMYLKLTKQTYAWGTR